MFIIFCSSRRRHTRCALVTGVRRVLFRSGRSHGPDAHADEGQYTDQDEEAVPDRPADEMSDHWPATLVIRRIVGPAGGRSKPKRTRSPVFRPRGIFGSGSWKVRSEEHTSELQSLMRNSYAVFCLQKQKPQKPLYNE